VKRLIHVELLEIHPNVNLYTVRFDGNKRSVFEQFLKDYSDKRFQSELQTISYWLQKIGENGALERYFKPEGHPMVKAIPLPPPSSKLRLYCFRISDNILIIGGGGEKTTRTYQENRFLHEQVKLIKKVGKKIIRYAEIGKVSITGQLLTGKLHFEIDL